MKNYCLRVKDQFFVEAKDEVLAKKKAFKLMDWTNLKVVSMDEMLKVKKHKKISIILIGIWTLSIVFFMASVVFKTESYSTQALMFLLTGLIISSVRLMLSK